MSAHIAPIPPKPWDTRIECMAECLECGIEWGWGASDDRLRQFVAEHNMRHHPSGAGDGPATLATAVVAALRAAGYSIVALPPPAKDLWDESDVALFQAESCTPIRVHWSGQVIYGSDWLNPSEARSDAAALLAAADLAEQESAE